MIYCPNCHEVVKEIICPYCGIEIMCYEEQHNDIHNNHIDYLRSNHRIIPNLHENKEDMKDILREEMYEVDKSND